MPKISRVGQAKPDFPRVGKRPSCSPVSAPGNMAGLLIWLENVEWHWKRRDQENCRGVLFQQDIAPAHTSSQTRSAIRTTSSLTVFTRPGPQCRTEGIHERTEICWRWGCYPHCKWLAGGPRSSSLLQWNPGFGKTLSQVYFCWRGLCWKWRWAKCISVGGDCWKWRWAKCISVGGDCVESDKVTCAYCVVNLSVVHGVSVVSVCCRACHTTRTPWWFYTVWSTRRRALATNRCYDDVSHQWLSVYWLVHAPVIDSWLSQQQLISITSKFCPVNVQASLNTESTRHSIDWP